jgi:hypothetical protein
LAFSRTATVSPALTEYEAMSTTVPLTVIARCETSWRASARVEPSLSFLCYLLFRSSSVSSVLIVPRICGIRVTRGLFAI